MRRLAVILCCVTAVGASSASAGSGSVVVTVDGQIGSFQIDVTTEAQVRALAGTPLKVEKRLSPNGKRQVGKALYYRCGGSCRTEYVINSHTGALSDFWSQSPRFVTVRGSHVGMTATEAVALEGRRAGPGCGLARYIHLRWNSGHIFVLVVTAGKVTAMTYLGPHSLSYNGLC